MNHNKTRSLEPTPDLILHLIKQDLKSSRLALGLAKIGLGADDYFPDLGRTAMTLIGFTLPQRDERLYKLYDNFVYKVAEMESKVFQANLNQLALELYNELVEERRARETN